jgi:hypothetical protein
MALQREMVALAVQPATDARTKIDACKAWATLEESLLLFPARRREPGTSLPGPAESVEPRERRESRRLAPIGAGDVSLASTASRAAKPKTAPVTTPCEDCPD